ncbi:type IV pilus assembly PilZ [Pseudomonas psychrotolerans L19]|uniref:Cyclic diguanosine monophosphate-binding protein n=1 Tax=Pseudomonas oryzihabitans TaxID=47885 RepID=A0A1G5NKY9_9PSED|nr:MULTISPECIES: PilZ domain-containing protein [Pseudomonas]EHK68887.1 type IV pilus assembly PilZ [Pseudomonas psychrotolerans L19]MBA1181922.1 PilZ domain-containing protein [Pseudomonas psychrotolerans]MBA1260978.1 PilZ domain-containing protein [Pseudomonas psychrotolerans]NMY90150.1 PilZ domain-containing protein [Pseudomonas psychrotolerans]ONN73376.1 PilZ domain-containing protein [Pseudomonas psychrotolerans]
MNDTNERRRFTRFTFDAPAQLHQGERQWAAPVDDISLKGVLLARPAEWSAQPSAAYQLRILLNDETQVSMDVELVRETPEQLAFACRQIDLDSISHLRRLVELNLGDETLLERELAALGTP